MAANGRPTRSETRRRTHDFLRRIDAGEPPLDACRNAHVNPERILALLGDDAFFAVFAAVRNGDLPATAAIVHMPRTIDEPAEPEAA